MSSFSCQPTVCWLAHLPPIRYSCLHGDESKELSMNDVAPVSPGAEERNWAVFCHLAALLGTMAWGFGSILGPLIVWLIKKDSMPFVDDQGKESLNFQITVF